MDNCKNDQKSDFKHIKKLWAQGDLTAWWSGEPIDPKDEESYRRYQRFEQERLKAPVLLATMIDMVKRWSKMKVGFIFHITGVPEATRFFKQRFNHVK